MKKIPFTKSYNPIDFNISTIDNLVYSILHSFLNTTTKRCNPSIDKIREISGLNKRTILKSLDSLESCGLIKISQTKVGNKTNNFYHLPLTPKFNMIPIEFIYNPEYEAKFKAFVITFRGLFINEDLVCKYNKTEITKMLDIDIRTLNKYMNKMFELNMIVNNNRNNALYLNNDVINWRLTKLENDVQDIKENKADKAEITELKNELQSYKDEMKQLKAILLKQIKENNKRDKQRELSEITL